MPPADAVLLAARRLVDARRDGVPCPPVRDLIGSSDVATAYAVQEQVVADLRSRGARVVGRKIGLTSPAVQAQLGVDRPDFGVLLDDMDVSGLDVVPLSGLFQPKVEAEIAFVLGSDLAEGPLDDAQVRAAVEVAIPALEIVDSRVAGWDITFGDTVADNGSSALYVLGASRLGLDAFTPVEAQMTMHVGDELVSSGNGAACLGDPLVALAWLARTALDVGDPLRAGQVVLSGALGPMVAVSPGTTYDAHISGLGAVRVTFSEEEWT
ncbi:fumarylacetoacetate hydrolase family protein [Nocardioides sp.]|uniref:2-keto-4-pentenoate hydratase n=1 Tax=Nocardioides sp. TaxID=35761 RepID=UPI00261BF9E4|nr:fumarylacetoacetate hydrolase family protein [Nocardioides sp.]